MIFSNLTANRRTALGRMGLLGTSAILAHSSPVSNRLLAQLNKEKNSDSEPPPYAFEVAFPAMGSILSIRWFDTLHTQRLQAREFAEGIETSAKQIAEHWNSVLSDYDRESEASLISEQADSGKWIEVSQDLAKVLDACSRWTKLSEGAFDASIGAVTRLRRRRNLPTPSQWDAALQHCGWAKLEWNSASQRIRFHVPGVRFDFGAIGKGWVVDRIFENLISRGITCCSVDFSGNMRLGAAPPETSGWPVVIDACSIASTSQATDTASELLRLRLENKSISTSGNRWQTLPDKSSKTRQETTSHIVDPESLEGLKAAQNITILADTAAEADAASTATSVRVGKNLAGWLMVLRDQPENFRWILQFSKNNALHLIAN